MNRTKVTEIGAMIGTTGLSKKETVHCHIFTQTHAHAHAPPPPPPPPKPFSLSSFHPLPLPPSSPPTTTHKHSTHSTRPPPPAPLSSLPPPPLLPHTTRQHHIGIIRVQARLRGGASGRGGFGGLGEWSCKSSARDASGERPHPRRQRRPQGVLVPPSALLSCSNGANQE